MANTKKTKKESTFLDIVADQIEKIYVHINSDAGLDPLLEDVYFVLSHGLIIQQIPF